LAKDSGISNRNLNATRYANIVGSICKIFFENNGFYPSVTTVVKTLVVYSKLGYDKGLLSLIVDHFGLNVLLSHYRKRLKLDEALKLPEVGEVLAMSSVTYEDRQVKKIVLVNQNFSPSAEMQNRLEPILSVLSPYSREAYKTLLGLTMVENESGNQCLTKNLIDNISSMYAAGIALGEKKIQLFIRFWGKAYASNAEGRFKTLARAKLISSPEVLRRFPTLEESAELWNSESNKHLMASFSEIQVMMEALSDLLARIRHIGRPLGIRWENAEQLLSEMNSTLVDPRLFGAYLRSMFSLDEQLCNKLVEELETKAGTDGIAVPLAYSLRHFSGAYFGVFTINGGSF